MSYFVITNSDGDTSIDEVSKEELLEKLNGEYWGSDAKFMEKIDNYDTNYWGDGMLIIKGEIVIPKAVSVVKQLDID